MIESFRHARKDSGSKRFLCKVTLAATHPEVEIIQSRAYKVIMVDQCRPLLRVQIVEWVSALSD